MKRKYISALLATAIINTPVMAKDAPMTRPGDRLLFDFGAVYENGWIQIDEHSKYTKDDHYGFSMISFVENTTAPSQNGVTSDAVKIDHLRRNDTDIRIDLPPGIYEVAVYSGDINYMNINIEGYPAIFNIEHDCTEARIEIPVTDGTLNVQPDQGSSGMELSISAMVVTRISDVESRKKRLFVCGDSLSATMYPLFLPQPLDEGYQGGWGQMLSAYLPDNIYVHNISSPGAGTKTYLDSDTLARRLHFAQRGDYVLISLGANDKNSITAKEYMNNLKEIIKIVRDLDCIPILASSAAQLKEFSGEDYDDLCYAQETKKVADELEVDHIDLHAAHTSYLTAIGYDTAQTLFWRQWDGKRDMTHPNRNGAGQIARLAAEELSAYEDFDGNITDHGISDDPRLKCHVDKRSVTLENTTPEDMDIVLISPEHISGKLTRTKQTVFTLPAYDVLDPDKAVIKEEFSKFNVGCPVYLIGEGIAIKVR